MIDTAVKDGAEHDGTAIIYFVLDRTSPYPLVILDWDIIQIEGALLEACLPTVFRNPEGLAAAHCARNGSVGVWIEDRHPAQSCCSRRATAAGMPTSSNQRSPPARTSARSPFRATTIACLKKPQREHRQRPLPISEKRAITC